MTLNLAATGSSALVVDVNVVVVTVRRPKSRLVRVATRVAT